MQQNPEPRRPEEVQEGLQGPGQERKFRSQRRAAMAAEASEGRPQAQRTDAPLSPPADSDRGQPAAQTERGEERSGPQAERSEAWTSERSRLQAQRFEAPLSALEDPLRGQQPPARPKPSGERAPARPKSKGPEPPPRPGSPRGSFVGPANPSEERAGPASWNLRRWLPIIAGGVAVLLLAVLSAQMIQIMIGREQERRRIAAEEAERAEYPLRYSDIIEENAAAYQLDPALIAGVILSESSFRPDATSYKDARGLMQLMPDTAAWIAGKLDESGFTADSSYDPALNVRFGCWYLKYLSNLFNGDPKLIVCAYHAGQNNVAAWLNNPRYSSDGVTLHTIPTDDTRTYADRVLTARDVYRKYYYPLTAEAGARAGTEEGS
jgi:soluble lytic murein transglycosylase